MLCVQVRDVFEKLPGFKNAFVIEFRCGSCYADAIADRLVLRTFFPIFVFFSLFSDLRRI